MIRYYVMQCHFSSYHYNLIRCHTTQCQSIPENTCTMPFGYHTIHVGVVCYHTIQCYSIPYKTMAYVTIQRRALRRRHCVGGGADQFWSASVVRRRSKKVGGGAALAVKFSNFAHLFQK